MKKIIFMRGCSGSGKSTKAYQILSDFINENENQTGIICSADEYFMIGDTYLFDPSHIGKAHEWCKFKANGAMSLGVNLIIIDNTNTQKWEMSDYVKIAEKFGYDAEDFIVGKFDDDSVKIYAERNRHKVSLEVIKKQAARFEK